MASSDEILSKYHGQALLDQASLAEFKRALLEPQSLHLRQILEMMVAAETFELGRADGAMEKWKEGQKADPQLLYSEALERAAVASSLCGRLQGSPLDDKSLFIIWQGCERCSCTYSEIDFGRSLDDIDRLLRTRTLATEDIGASNVFSKVSRYVKFSPVRPADISNLTRQDLYRSLIARLEQAEADTRQNEARLEAAKKAPYAQAGMAMADYRKAERFFRQEDYAMLEMLRVAIDEPGPSTAMRAKAESEALLEARRKRLFESISPIWRDQFIWLLDIPHPGNAEIAKLEKDPRLAPLGRLDEAKRGIILSDLVRLRSDYPDWIGGQVVPVEERLGGFARPNARQKVGDAGFEAWMKLDFLTNWLAKLPVQLDDPHMARLIAAAQSWRPLCQFAMLDSAEMTLQAGRAPRTIAALQELASQPSHVVIAGDAGPDYDGDVWWNGAPPRVYALIEKYGGQAAARSSIVARIFGKLLRPPF